MAAPAELDDTDVVWAWHAPPPASQVAEPVDERGFPAATAPSDADDVVCATPEQAAPAEQSTDALADDVLDGPVVGWPATGLPVAGSIVT